MSDIAVLCIHGFMGHPGEFKELKNFFDRLGYDTYSFVLSGHQGRKLKNATRKDWELDCTKNIEILKNKGYKKIVLVGHSMGGVLATMMALKYIDYVYKLILIDAAFEYLKMKNGKLKIMPSLKQSLKVLKEIKELNKNNYSSIKSCSLSAIEEFHDLVKEHASDIKKVKCPVLFLHGINDSIVPIDSIKKIYEEMNNDKKEFIEVKNGSHWFLSSK